MTKYNLLVKVVYHNGEEANIFFPDADLAYLFYYEVLNFDRVKKVIMEEVVEELKYVVKEEFEYKN